MNDTETKPQQLAHLRTELVEVDNFYQQLEDNAQDAYRTYRMKAVTADVFASVLISLVDLSVTAYRISVLHLPYSKFMYTFQSLKFAYAPIVTVIRRFGWQPVTSQQVQSAVQQSKSLNANILASVANFAVSVTTPSNIASILTNLKEGHWRDALTRHPENEILTVKASIHAQRRHVYEMTVARINALERDLAVPQTYWTCRA